MKQREPEGAEAGLIEALLRFAETIRARGRLTRAQVALLAGFDGLWDCMSLEEIDELDVAALVGQGRPMARPGKPDPEGDDLYLAVVSEKQGLYRFLSDGTKRISLAETREELDLPGLAHLDIAQAVAETDMELRYS